MSCGGDDSLTQDIKPKGPVPECVLTAAEDIILEEEKNERKKVTLINYVNIYNIYTYIKPLFLCIMVYDNNNKHNNFKRKKNLFILYKLLQK